MKPRLFFILKKFQNHGICGSHTLYSLVTFQILNLFISSKSNFIIDGTGVQFYGTGISTWNIKVVSEIVYYKN